MHLAVRLSVCLSVCLVRHRKSKIGANARQKRSNRCANFQLKMSYIKTTKRQNLERNDTHLFRANIHLRLARQPARTLQRAG